MAPIVPTLLQGLVLVLLYLFVWRIARAILRDVRAGAPAAREVVIEQVAPSPAPRQEIRERRPGRGSRRREGRSPRELVVHRPDAAPQVIPLDGSEVSIGRGSSSTIRLDDPYVSERHASVRREGADWIVSDLGSTNGTVLNADALSQPTPLVPGDQLSFGRTVVEVRR